MSPRRFLAQHASSCSLQTGFSSPRLTDSTCVSVAPGRTSRFLIASERRCPSPRLYSRLPRSSALPWISILAFLYWRRNAACASTIGTYSTLIASESNSKYTLRFDRTFDGSLSRGSLLGSVIAVLGILSRVTGSVVVVGGFTPRSSTPAGAWVSGVLWHAASTAVIVAASRMFLMVVLL